MKLMVILLLLLSTPSQAAFITAYLDKESKVIDGDTISGVCFIIQDKPLIYLRGTIRLYGIDAPEKDPKSTKELKRLLPLNKRFKVQALKMGYYKRVIARIIINKIDVSKHLLKLKLVKPYRKR